MVTAPLMTERSVSSEKQKGRGTVTSLRGGKKCKRTKKIVANIVSNGEIEEMLAGPSHSDLSGLVVKVLDHRLGELAEVIDRNTMVLGQVLKQLERLTGVTTTNYLWMTKLLNQLGEPELTKDKGKVRAVKDERDESGQDDGDDGETDE